MRSPFVVRNELSELEQFYGRESKIREILGFLNKSNPQNISIVGQRRIGKSFLLKYLSCCNDVLNQYLGNERKHYTFVYWDLTRRQPLTPAAFFRQLIQLIEPNLPSRLRELFPYDDADDDELDDILDDGLDLIEGAGHHLIVFLDEFSYLTKNPACDDNFFSQQRSFCQRPGLTYVTSTVSELREFCHSDMIANSPFFNVFTTISLELMQPKEIREFTLPFLKRQISFDKGALSEIERITGGHPCLLAILCDTLWRKTDSGTTVTQVDISAHYNKVYDFCEADLGYYWQHLTAKEQDAARSLVQGTKSINELGTVGKTLIKKSVVRKDKNKLSLFSPLMIDYLEKQKTNPEMIAQLFSDTQEGRENLILLMRVQLQSMSGIPKEWTNDIERAIQNILEDQNITCMVCGRRLVNKLLTAIWKKDYPTRTYADSELQHALEELKPQADNRITKPPTFSKPTLDCIWFLKNMGDCGAHNYKVTSEDALLLVHTAITACRQLFEEGYC